MGRTSSAVPDRYSFNNLDYTTNNMRLNVKKIQSRLKIIKNSSRKLTGQSCYSSTNVNRKNRSEINKPYLSIQRCFSRKFYGDKDALKRSMPIISNMPWVNSNMSAILINSSPFALTDRRFGILHHCYSSKPYL